MKRAALIVSGTFFALLDGVLVAFIVVCVALIGQRAQEETAVPAPPAEPTFSGSWRMRLEEEVLAVSAMRAGRHCWVYTPLGLDPSHRYLRALPSQALCSSL